MKKLTCLTILLASTSVYAQGPHSFSFTPKQIYFDDKFLVAELTSTNFLDLSTLAEPTKSGNRETRKESLLSKSSGISANFSRSNQLQYGLAFAVESPLTYGQADKLVGSEEMKTNFSTSAFLNYRVKHNYSLNSEIKFSSGRDFGTRFSFGVGASNILARKHKLTTIFNVNWGNRSATTSDLFGQETRKYGLSLNNSNLNQTDLQLSSRWNWEIDSNWSLSSGISAKYFLGNANKNPFATQRAPVTVFSVATYRF